MNVFKPFYRGYGAFKEIALFMTTAGRMLDNIKVYGNGRVVTTPTSISFHIEGSAFPYGKIFRFGIVKKSEFKVTIAAGGVTLGNLGPISAEETIVTISNDGDYIGLELDTTTTTLTIENFGTTKPVPDGDHHRVWLYRFSKNDDGTHLDPDGGCNVFGVASLVAGRFTG